MKMEHDFNEWLAEAKRNETFVYYRGNVPRKEKRPHILQMAWDEYKSGKITLVQKRIGKLPPTPQKKGSQRYALFGDANHIFDNRVGEFDYIAVKL